MPSYKPRVTVYTDEITNEKLAYIAKTENRSASNYTEYLIKREIKAYEAEHGEIEITKKPNRAEALEEFSKAIHDNKQKKAGVGETLKKSLKAGFSYGNADN